MAVDGMRDEEEIVDEVKAGTKLCDELVVDTVRVDIFPEDEVADEVRVAAVEDECKNDIFLGEGVVDDVRVVAVGAVLDAAVAVDKGVDVVIAVDVVLHNDVVVDVVLDDEIVVDGVLDDEVVVEVDEMVTREVKIGYQYRYQYLK